MTDGKSGTEVGGKKNWLYGSETGGVRRVILPWSEIRKPGRGVALKEIQIMGTEQKRRHKRGKNV